MPVAVVPVARTFNTRMDRVSPAANAQVAEAPSAQITSRFPAPEHLIARVARGNSALSDGVMLKTPDAGSLKVVISSVPARHEAITQMPVDPMSSLT